MRCLIINYQSNRVKILKHWQVLSVLGLGLLLLSGCSATAQPYITSKKSAQIAQSNRQANATATAKAQDASAQKATGAQLHATNDHITSPTMATKAVQQVLNNPTKQLFQAIPTSNRDAHGHHYFQVEAYRQQPNGQRGPLLRTYFVYTTGLITTKQAD